MEAFKKELDINYNKDFSDYEHVNIYGAQKVTSYVGNILKTEFDIPNHKGESDYAKWNSDYTEYKNWLKKRMKIMNLPTQEDILE